MTDVRLRDGLRTCLLVFVAVRAGLFVLSVAGVGIVPLPPGQPTSVPGWPAHPIEAGFGNLFTATERQDALWFLRIAAEGYRADDLSAAFFPLYPIAVRIIAWLPGVGTLGAALLVSNAAFLGSLVLLHGLARLEFDGDRGVADRAVRFAALFPTAFFLMAPYSESLFLFTTLCAFWFARRDRWGLAAIAGMGAGLTRGVGLVLPLALSFEAVRAADLRRVAMRLAAAAAPALGAALYLGAWWRWADAPLMPLEVQSSWRPEETAPWSSFVKGVEFAVRYGGWSLVDALFVIGVLLVLIAGVRLLRPSYTAYGLASLALPLFATFPGRPFLSMPRFCAVLFPVALILARQRLIPEPAVTATFAGGWAILALLFMNWQYIF
jgi:hypothetical protein